MEKKQQGHVFPDRLIPFDRESDARRVPALLAPRMKSLNGIWLMCPQRTRARKAFFDPDFDPAGDIGIPVPCTAAAEVRSLRLVREFELDSSWLHKRNGSIFLCFEDAGPQLSFWINGSFQGRFHSKKIQPTREFDITDAVRPGVNRIALQLDRTSGSGLPPGITGAVRLLLRPEPGLLTAGIRWDGQILSGTVTIRNSSDRDRTLTLDVKLQDEAGRPLARSASFRNLFVKAGSKADFQLRKRFREPFLKSGESAGSVLLSLKCGRAVLECRRVAFDEEKQTLPLPVFSGVPDGNGTNPFPIRGPRRDPVSLEDDGENLWLSATNGLLACFGRTSGTVDSLELDGISLLDRGPLPGWAMNPEDMTLAKENGDAEVETLAGELRLRWRFFRSGMIRFTAELSPENGRSSLTMHLPPHLDRLFRDDAEEMVTLSCSKEKPLCLTSARGLVFTGDLKAGLALLFLTPAEIFWRKHQHEKGCCHHSCSCEGEGSDHGGTEILLKAKRSGAISRLDFLILPFAPNSLRFENLFTRV